MGQVQPCSSLNCITDKNQNIIHSEENTTDFGTQIIPPVNSSYHKASKSRFSHSKVKIIKNQKFVHFNDTKKVETLNWNYSEPYSLHSEKTKNNNINESLFSFQDDNEKNKIYYNSTIDSINEKQQNLNYSNDNKFNEYKYQTYISQNEPLYEKNNNITSNEIYIFKPRKEPEIISTNIQLSNNLDNFKSDDTPNYHYNTYSPAIFQETYITDNSKNLTENNSKQENIYYETKHIDNTEYFSFKKENNFNYSDHNNITYDIPKQNGLNSYEGNYFFDHGFEKSKLNEIPIEKKYDDFEKKDFSPKFDNSEINKIEKAKKNTLPPLFKSIVLEVTQTPLEDNKNIINPSSKTDEVYYDEIISSPVRKIMASINYSKKESLKSQSIDLSDLIRSLDKTSTDKTPDNINKILGVRETVSIPFKEPKILTEKSFSTKNWGDFPSAQSFTVSQNNVDEINESQESFKKENMHHHQKLRNSKTEYDIEKLGTIDEELENQEKIKNSILQSNEPINNYNRPTSFSLDNKNTNTIVSPLILKEIQKFLSIKPIDPIIKPNFIIKNHNKSKSVCFTKKKSLSISIENENLNNSAIILDRKRSRENIGIEQTLKLNKIESNGNPLDSIENDEFGDIEENVQTFCEIDEKINVKTPKKRHKKNYFKKLRGKKMKERNKKIEIKYEKWDNFNPKSSKKTNFFKKLKNKNKNKGINSEEKEIIEFNIKKSKRTPFFKKFRNLEKERKKERSKIKINLQKWDDFDVNKKNKKSGYFTKIKKKKLLLKTELKNEKKEKNNEKKENIDKDIKKNSIIIENNNKNENQANETKRKTLIYEKKQIEENKQLIFEIDEIENKEINDREIKKKSIKIIESNLIGNKNENQIIETNGEKVIEENNQIEQNLEKLIELDDQIKVDENLEEKKEINKDIINAPIIIIENEMKNSIHKDEIVIKEEIPIIQNKRESLIYETKKIEQNFSQILEIDPESNKNELVILDENIIEVLDPKKIEKNEAKISKISQIDDKTTNIGNNLPNNNDKEIIINEEIQKSLKFETQNEEEKTNDIIEIDHKINENNFNEKKIKNNTENETTNDLEKREKINEINTKNCDNFNNTDVSQPKETKEKQIINEKKNSNSLDQKKLNNKKKSLDKTKINQNNRFSKLGKYTEIAQNLEKMFSSVREPEKKDEKTGKRISFMDFLSEKIVSVPELPALILPKNRKKRSTKKLNFEF